MNDLSFHKDCSVNFFFIPEVKSTVQYKCIENEIHLVKQFGPMVIEKIACLV